MAKQTKTNPVEVYLQRPQAPVYDIHVGAAPFKGGADAKVTVVEFSDFQCQYCREGAQRLKELNQKYGNKIKIVFKNFPLSFHNHANIAAQAGFCAQDQGNDSFWKMHDKMFQDQKKLDKASLLASAKEIGLKMQEFTSCLESGKHKAKVESDVKEGEKLGLRSTPTFFVNGKLVKGLQPMEYFSELIDEELNK